MFYIVHKYTKRDPPPKSTQIIYFNKSSHLNAKQAAFLSIDVDESNVNTLASRWYECDMCDKDITHQVRIIDFNPIAIVRDMYVV